MKWFILGLLVAALGSVGYYWFSANYVLLSNEEMRFLLMAVLEMYCQ
jgi:hypothetical protein